MRFKDEVILEHVAGGNGGAGCVSFRREKYIPKGGPDGGDGGRGGAVFIQALESLQTLNHLLSNKKYTAKNGDPGRGNKQSGKNGGNYIISVPVGTHVFSYPQMTMQADLCCPDQIIQVASGGKGGRGNQHYATSINQAPRRAQLGEKGETVSLLLRLKLLADIGFLGLPNAGKSTLLNALTGQHSKTANYSFTTLQPYLGVLVNEQKSQRLILADIPGIIAGASKGHGLGLSFLRHIERVRLLVIVLNLESKDMLKDLKILLNEAKSYNEKILDKKMIIVINKTDIIEYDKKWIAQETNNIIKNFADQKKTVIAISALKKWNLSILAQKLFANVT